MTAAKQNRRRAASFPRQDQRRRAGRRRIASRRNGANQATALASVATPQAAPAVAARPGEDDRTSRTEARTASVVTRISVGSWRTNTTRVTRSGLTARNNPPASAQDSETEISRNSRNAATTPSAWRIDWKAAADSTDEVPVSRNHPPRRTEKQGRAVDRRVDPVLREPGSHRHAPGQRHVLDVVAGQSRQRVGVHEDHAYRKGNRQENSGGGPGSSGGIPDHGFSRPSQSASPPPGRGASRFLGFGINSASRAG